MFHVVRWNIIHLLMYIAYKKIWNSWTTCLDELTNIVFAEYKPQCRCALFSATLVSKKCFIAWLWYWQNYHYHIIFKRLGQPVWLTKLFWGYRDVSVCLPEINVYNSNFHANVCWQNVSNAWAEWYAEVTNYIWCESLILTLYSILGWLCLLMYIFISY